MKKLLLTTLFVVTFFAATAVSASAVVNDTVKVGLKYGSNALFSANLENYVGEGYAFGYFDDNREFVAVGETDEIAISMTAAGTVYMNSSGTYSVDEPGGSSDKLGSWRIQAEGFEDFQTAAEAAEVLGGWPAWIDEMYVVRMGCYDSEEDAEIALEETLAALEASGDIFFYTTECTSTGIIVTETRTTNILFEYDCWGVLPLGVMPDGEGDDAVTWFKGYRYYGGFEYARITGGDLNVCNVVNLEDYVKGVIPHEMSPSWPREALKAQAICARTYASASKKHLGSYGFDVCNTADCQVYYGVNGSTDLSDQAVEETEGLCLYYGGKLVDTAVYHSSDGGATEDAANVWGGKVPYLVGKKDPYEELINIPSYSWTVTYSASELTWILQQKGYSIGTVKNVYVSEYTPMGNVKKVTFEGTKNTKTVSGDTCRTIFYSSTYGKSVKSMRFSINGDGPVTGEDIYINNKNNKFSTLDGIAVISGSGEIVTMGGGTVSVLTADGLEELSGGGTVSKPSGSSSNTSGTFVIAGAGSGHNVGMSQYGAKAMAENGYDYDEILEFYYTGIEIDY